MVLSSFLSNELNILITVGDEKCICKWPIRRSGKWNDLNCGWTLPYACEFPSFIG
jgi:hypothetical protein